MDARFDTNSRLTADRMAGLHQAAAVHRLRRAASATVVSEPARDRDVVARGRSWWWIGRGHRPALRTVTPLDAS